MGSRFRLLAVLCMQVALGNACNGSTPNPPSATQIPAANASAGVTAQPADRGASDVVLAGAAKAFLETWLIRQDPRGAARQHASAEFADERFVPGGWFNPDDYRKRFPSARSAAVPAAIEPQDFQNRLGEYLERLTDRGGPTPGARAASGNLAEMLTTLSPGTIRDVEPQLAALIESKGLREVTVAGVACLGYPVRTGQDIDWISSDTIGYQSDAMAELIRQKGLDIQAVVCRLRPDDASHPHTLVVTLWSDEGRRGQIWRLLGAEPVPAQ